MALSNDELLAKAVFDTSAFGGAEQAPLAIEQVTQFIELMTAGQDMLPDVQTKTSSASKWQESIIDFAGRIAYPGVSGTRNTTGQRSAPSTGIVEMNTVLLRAEVPVVDEVLEDNVAGPALAGSIERLIADRFGFDIEEMFINGVFSNTQTTSLDLLDGWLQQAQDLGNVVAASSYGQDYQTVFKEMILNMPLRFLRRLEQDGAFYVPKRVEYIYRDILGAREDGSLGGVSLTSSNELRYQGILIKGVANNTVTSGSPDTATFLLGHKSNFYAGYQRAMKFETYRDPREGAMSFVVTARVDAKIAVPSAVVAATSVNVEP